MNGIAKKADPASHANSAVAKVAMSAAGKFEELAMNSGALAANHGASKHREQTEEPHRKRSRR